MIQGGEARVALLAGQNPPQGDPMDSQNGGVAPNATEFPCVVGRLGRPFQGPQSFAFFSCRLQHAPLIIKLSNFVNLYLDWLLARLFLICCVAVKLSQHEIEICKRLRIFREGLQISRSRFAVSIGIGSERLASYEGGRAPLRYEVYRAINQRFFINPIWLGGQDVGVQMKHPYDDSAILPLISSRMLFSEIFTNLILPQHLKNRPVANAALEDLTNQLRNIFADKELVEHLNQNPKLKKEMDEAVRELTKRLSDALESDARFNGTGSKKKRSLKNK